MGTEGEKLDVLAKDFMQENPDVKVDVTPIAWDVAHDKLITAVAGNKTPDISQMGTTWMGEFAKTRRARGGAGHDRPGLVLRQRRSRPASSTTRPTASRGTSRRGCSTTAPTSPRRPASPRRPTTLGRAEGDGEGDEGEGRREVRHLPLPEQLAGVPALRLAERRRRHRRATSSRSTRPRPSRRSSSTSRSSTRG